MALISIKLGEDEVDYSSARRYALVASFLKFLCTILLIITVAIDTSTAGVDYHCAANCNSYEAISTMDTCCLRERWAERQRYEWLNFAFDMLEAISAFVFMAPMLALGDVFGRRITANKLMITAFAASAGISLLEFMFRAGTTTTANWMSEWAIMNGDETNPANAAAIRSLSIAYQISVGQGLWAFAADDLFLGVGLLLASSLTYKFGQLPRAHAHLGVVTGLLAVVNFCLELARFGDWRNLSIVSSTIYAFVGFVLLPAWLTMLACFLGQYSVPDTRRGLTAQMDQADDADAATGAAAPAANAMVLEENARL